MFNIFLTVFFSTLSFAFLEPYFFIGYLISIALFGLYQAIFMANAGGAWDNAKKIVEVELKMKGTPLHAATVVGDTVGDPFKDTSSVALNRSSSSRRYSAFWPSSWVSGCPPSRGRS
jgi:K(+)-stimulated pyrophosphate-energized sodium pump